ncbi:MAG: hypothetical protein ACKO23_15680, partial [Gemmataceae bacterium]
PDLTKMDPKWNSQDVMKHILEPSLKIDDKFRTWTLQLDNGKTVTGMILQESPDQVQIIENPLAAGAKPITVKKSEIENRNKSPNSLMPKGLLDRMTKEEILDLLGYVISGGNPKHPVFQSGHGHGNN